MVLVVILFSYFFLDETVFAVLLLLFGFDLVYDVNAIFHLP